MTIIRHLFNQCIPIVLTLPSTAYWIIRLLGGGGFLGLRLITKFALHTTTTTHPQKLLGHFQAYQRAEIWYVDLTHKYKVIQGVLVGRSPPLGRSPSKYNFFYHTTFRVVLGIVWARDLVCRSKIYPDRKFVGKTKFLTKKNSTK